MTYKPTVSGAYKLNVKLYGQHIQNSPFAVNISPGPAFPPSCYVTDTSLQSLHAGESGSFIVVVRDECNNLLVGGGSKVLPHNSFLFFENLAHSLFKVVPTMSGPTEITPTVLDKTDGSFVISYTPTIIGEYSVEV